jgi:CBS domain-containing protein
MTPTVLAILPSTSVDVAVQIMVGAGIHHLPVMERGACVGLLHETDAVWYLASRSSSERRLTAGEAARSPVATVGPDETVRQAAERMFASSSDALVVVDGEQIIGILTANDLLGVLAGRERGRGPRHESVPRAVDGGQRRERTHTTRPVPNQTPDRSGEPESERTVVVGIDGSAASRQALAWAVNYASRLGLAVRAVSVCSLALPTAFMPGGGAPMEDPDVLIQAHQEQLDAAVRQVDPASRGVSVETSVILSEPGPGLCAVAAHAPALVLGSRGRGKVLSALLGSVSAYCVRRAKTAVVVIPPAAVTGGSTDADVPEGATSEPTPAGADSD